MRDYDDNYFRCARRMLNQVITNCGLNRSNAVSQMCPRKEDYVSVKVNKKKHVQNCLLLADFKELHYNFLKENGVLNFGFSKFCEIRPKEYITVSNSSSYRVCTCSHYQKELNYEELMSKLVCGLSNKECVLICCHNCPMVDILKIIYVHL